MISSPLISAKNKAVDVVNKDIQKNIEKRNEFIDLQINFEDIVQQEKTPGFWSWAASWIVTPEDQITIEKGVQELVQMDGTLRGLYKEIGNTDNQQIKLDKHAEALTLKNEMIILMMDLLKKADPEESKNLKQQLEDSYVTTFEQFQHLTEDSFLADKNVQKEMKNPEHASSFLKLQKQAIEIKTKINKLKEFKGAQKNASSPATVAKSVSKIARYQLRISEAKQKFLKQELRLAKKFNSTSPLVSTLSTKHTEAKEQISRSKQSYIKAMSSPDLIAEKYALNTTAKENISTYLEGKISDEGVEKGIKGETKAMIKGYRALLTQKEKITAQIDHLKDSLTAESITERDRFETNLKIKESELANTKINLQIASMEREVLIAVREQVVEKAIAQKVETGNAELLDQAVEELDAARLELSSKTKNLRKQAMEARRTVQENIVSIQTRFEIDDLIASSVIPDNLDDVNKEIKFLTLIQQKLGNVREKKQLETFKEWCAKKREELQSGSQSMVESFVTIEDNSSDSLIRILDELNLDQPAIPPKSTGKNGSYSQLNPANTTPNTSPEKLASAKIRNLNDKVVEELKQKRKIAAEYQSDFLLKDKKDRSKMLGGDIHAWQLTTLGSILTEEEGSSSKAYKLWTTATNKHLSKKINKQKEARWKTKQQISVLKAKEKHLVSHMNLSGTSDARKETLTDDIVKVQKEIKSLERQDIVAKIHLQKTMMEAVLDKTTRHQIKLQSAQKKVKKARQSLTKINKEIAYVSAMLEGKKTDIDEKTRKSINEGMSEIREDEREGHLIELLKNLKTDRKETVKNEQTSMYDVRELEYRLNVLDEAFEDLIGSYQDIWTEPSGTVADAAKEAAKKLTVYGLIAETAPPTPAAFRQKKIYADLGYDMLSEIVKWTAKFDDQEGDFKSKLTGEIMDFVKWAEKNPETAAYLAADISQVASIAMDASSVTTFYSVMKAKVFTHSILSGLGKQPKIEITSKEFLRFRALADLCKHAPVLMTVAKGAPEAATSVGKAFTTGGLTAGLITLGVKVTGMMVDCAKTKGLQEAGRALSFENSRKALKYTNLIQEAMRNDFYYDSIAEKESLEYLTSLGAAYSAVRKPKALIDDVTFRLKDWLKTVRYASSPAEKIFRASPAIATGGLAIALAVSILGGPIAIGTVFAAAAFIAPTIIFTYPRVANYVDKFASSTRRTMLKGEAERAYKKQFVQGKNKTKTPSLVKYRNGLVNEYMDKYLLPKLDTELIEQSNKKLRPEEQKLLQDLESQITRDFKEKLSVISYDKQTSVCHPAKNLVDKTGHSLSKLRKEVRSTLKNQEPKLSSQEINRHTELLTQRIYNNLIENTVKKQMDTIIHEKFVEEYWELYEDDIIKGSPTSDKGNYYTSDAAISRRAKAKKERDKKIATERERLQKRALADTGDPRAAADINKALGKAGSPFYEKPVAAS